MTVQQQNSNRQYSQHRGRPSGRTGSVFGGQSDLPPTRSSKQKHTHVNHVNYISRRGGRGKVAAGRHLSRGRRLEVRGHIGLHHAAAQRVWDEHSSGSPADAALLFLSHHQDLTTRPTRSQKRRSPRREPNTDSFTITMPSIRTEYCALQSRR